MTSQGIIQNVEAKSPSSSRCYSGCLVPRCAFLQLRLKMVNSLLKPSELKQPDLVWCFQNRLSSLILLWPAGFTAELSGETFWGNHGSEVHTHIPGRIKPKSVWARAASGSWPWIRISLFVWEINLQHFMCLKDICTFSACTIEGQQDTRPGHSLLSDTGQSVFPSVHVHVCWGSNLFHI